MEKYFLHSPYCSAKNTKEKEAAALLLMHENELYTEFSLGIMIESINRSIADLNIIYPRSRTISLCISGFNKAHRIMYINNGTDSSVASIQIHRVKCECYG